jgi:hypothetical protein
MAEVYPRDHRQTCSYDFIVTRGRQQSNFSPGWHFDEPQGAHTSDAAAFHHALSHLSPLDLHDYLEKNTLLWTVMCYNK